MAIPYHDLVKMIYRHFPHDHQKALRRKLRECIRDGRDPRIYQQYAPLATQKAGLQAIYDAAYGD